MSIPASLRVVAAVVLAAALSGMALAQQPQADIVDTAVAAG